MNLNLTENYIIVNNIDCSDTINWNSGEGFIPVGVFAGSLNGQNFTISDLYINRPTSDYVGLFSIFEGIVHDLGLVDVNITGQKYVGALIGVHNTELENISVSNLYSSGNIKGDISIGEGIGGLIGSYQHDGTIFNSYSNANVEGGIFTTGGLVGELTGGSILNSHATGKVSGNSNVGGLVGYSDGIIINSYAIGNIECNDTCGGLVGYSSVSIINSYSRGLIINSSSSNIGGFVGLNDGGSCSNSFWDIEISMQNLSSCGTGKLTSEMKNISTYSSWNIVSSETNLNNGYPYWDIDSWIIFESSPVIPIPQSSVENNQVFQVLRSSGAGLGKFIQIIVIPLGILLISLAIVGIIILILYELKNSFQA